MIHDGMREVRRALLEADVHFRVAKTFCERVERRQPRILNGSRRNRIAHGSGTSVQEVNRLLKQFSEMNKMMKQLRGTRGAGRTKKNRR